MMAFLTYQPNVWPTILCTSLFLLRLKRFDKIAPFSQEAKVCHPWRCKELITIEAILLRFERYYTQVDLVRINNTPGRVLPRGRCLVWELLPGVTLSICSSDFQACLFGRSIAIPFLGSHVSPFRSPRQAFATMSFLLLVDLPSIKTATLVVQVTTIVVTDLHSLMSALCARPLTRILFMRKMSVQESLLPPDIQRLCPSKANSQTGERKDSNNCWAHNPAWCPFALFMSVLYHF